MLEQLSQDFELVLYSAQPKDYTKEVAKLLTINPPTAETDQGSKKRDASKGAPTPQ